MYRTAGRDRMFIHDATLVGLRGYLGDAMIPPGQDVVATTIDTLAQDTAAVIQATTTPNQPPTYKGQPIYPPAASAGIGVGMLLAVGVGVFILAAAMKGR
jgi:hypothetical protein